MLIDTDDANPHGGISRPSETFAAFYGREFLAMVSLAASVSGDTGVAEDLAQEAFHKASLNWDTLSSYDKPGTWVRRVVINLALNRKRRITREAKALVRLAPEATPSLPTETDHDVWKAVAKLPGKQRAAVALFYAEDRTTTEIAEILECSESTAGAHLHKARKKLAQILGEPLDADSPQTGSHHELSDEAALVPAEARKDQP